MKETLGALTQVFTILSLLAVGGVNTILPEMHRQVVDVHGWVTASQFTDLFAIAQASPGPNMMIVTLIGWHAAGWAGAIVATAALCGPSCLLTYFVSGFWHRFRDARWRRIVQAGLAPVTVGLLLASGYVVTVTTDESLAAFIVTGVTFCLVFWTRIHPLWALGIAGVLGVAGVL